MQVMAQVAVALPVLGQAPHQHESALPGKIPPYVAKVFSPEELRLLGQLADVIIPTTDTPGAAQAGVPLLIDGLDN